MDHALEPYCRWGEVTSDVGEDYRDRQGVDLDGRRGPSGLLPQCIRDDEGGVVHARNLIAMLGGRLTASVPIPEIPEVLEGQGSVVDGAVES